jgi:hypothetical protein
VRRQTLNPCTPAALPPPPPPKQDHKLRIYCRNRDPRVCAAVRSAFRRWSERQAGWGRAQHSTPFKFRSAHGAGAGGGGLAGGRGGCDENGARASKRARSLNFGGGGGGGDGAAAAKAALAPSQQRGDQRPSHSPIPE